MILNTNGDLFPEGRYKFRVSEIPEEVDVKGYVAYQWAFEADTEEGPMPYRERFMVWLLAPVLRGLGFPEVKPGEFEYEPPSALNRECMATIKHAVLEKTGKTVARMTAISPVGAAMPKAVRNALAAQAPAGKEADIDF